MQHSSFIKVPLHFGVKLSQNTQGRHRRLKRRKSTTMILRHPTATTCCGSTLGLPCFSKIISFRKTRQLCAGSLSGHQIRPQPQFEDKPPVQKIFNSNTQFHSQLLASRRFIFASAVCSARLRVRALAVLLLLETLTVLVVFLRPPPSPPILFLALVGFFLFAFLFVFFVFLKREKGDRTRVQNTHRRGLRVAVLCSSLRPMYFVSLVHLRRPCRRGAARVS